MPHKPGHKKKKPEPQLSPENITALVKDIDKRGGVEPALKEQLKGTKFEQTIGERRPVLTPKFEKQIVKPTPEQELPFQERPTGFTEALGLEEKQAEAEAGREELETAFAEDPEKVIAQSVGALAVGAIGGIVGGAAISYIKGMGVFAAKTGGETISRTMGNVGRRVNVDVIGKELGLTGEQTAALATQIGKTRINILAREALGYATNPKSTSLTLKWLGGLGIAAFAASFIKDLYGTYPMAKFIGTEEALQQAGMGFYVAWKEGDQEGMNAAIAAQEEIIFANETWKDKTPYINVVKSVNDYANVTTEMLDMYKRVAESTGGVSEFTLSRLEEKQFDQEYFKLIRAKKFDEAEAMLNRRITQVKGGR